MKHIRKDITSVTSSYKDLSFFATFGCKSRNNRELNGNNGNFYKTELKLHASQHLYFSLMTLYVTSSHQHGVLIHGHDDEHFFVHQHVVQIVANHHHWHTNLQV